MSPLRTAASGELYDPETETWSSAGAMSTPREYHSATLLDGGQVLVVGGQSCCYPEIRAYSSAEIFDPDSGTWSPTGSMGANRLSHPAILLADGTVLVVGGSTLEGVRFRAVASAERYRPSTIPPGDPEGGEAGADKASAESPVSKDSGRTRGASLSAIPDASESVASQLEERQAVAGPVAKNGLPPEKPAKIEVKNK